MNYKLANFSLSFFLSRSLFSLLGLSLLIQLDSSMAIVDIVIGTIFVFKNATNVTTNDATDIGISLGSCRNHFICIYLASIDK